MRKFFREFKQFITRGNVIDLAIAVIIAGAFTAIVTAVTSKILTPCINGLIRICTGGEDVTSVYTFLFTAYNTDGTIDLAKSIYIDWGAFISAIINFILITLFLFFIVKSINKSKELLGKNSKLLKGIPTFDERKMLKAEGIKLKDKAAVKLWLDNKRKADAKKEAQEKAIAEANKPENILKEIRDLLKSQQTKKSSVNSYK